MDSKTLMSQGAQVHGLTSAEAGRRLREHGPNATPEIETGFWSLLAYKFMAPVPCLLEAAIALQIYLGEYLEAGVISVLLIFNAALGVLQESRAKVTLAALKSRFAPKASVLRDDRWQTTDVADLVLGDVVALSLGGTLRSIIHKTRQVAFLAAGLISTSTVSAL